LGSFGRRFFVVYDVRSGIRLALFGPSCRALGPILKDNVFFV